MLKHKTQVEHKHISLLISGMLASWHQHWVWMITPLSVTEPRAPLAARVSERAARRVKTSHIWPVYLDIWQLVKQTEPRLSPKSKIHSLRLSQSLSPSPPPPPLPPPLSSCPWAFLLPHGKHLAAPDKRGGSTLNQKSVPVADLSHHEGHRPYTACRLNLRSRSRHSQGDTVCDWVCVCVCEIERECGGRNLKNRRKSRLTWLNVLCKEQVK